MKNWLNLIFVGGVMLLMGCSTQSDLQAPASETKDIRFGISQQQARAYFAEDPAGALCVGWDLGDGIGISATKDGEPFGANYEYRVKESLDEGASAVLTASSTQYTYRWSEEAAYTFYGYYPYTGTPDAEPHYLTSVSLPAEQPQAAVNDFSHLQAWWVMKAEPYTIQGLQEQVELSFRGVFSIVELKLRYAKAPSKNRSIERVQLNAQTTPLAVTIGNLTLTSDKVAEKQEPALIVNDGVKSVDVPLERPANLDETTTQSIWLLVAPGAHAAGELAVQLATVDSYRLDMTIPEAVTFEPNKVYRKEVVINPDDFYYYRDPSAPAVTYFKPVTKLEDITDGEYLLGFRYTKESPECDYLMPVAPIVRNPILTDHTTANVAPYLDMGILSVDGHYVWKVTQGTNGLTFRGTAANGNDYYLIGCDKMQGFSIATSLTEGGYKSYIGTYTDEFYLSVVENSGGFRLQIAATSARLLNWYTDSSIRNAPVAEENGVVLLYKKVTE